MESVRDEMSVGGGMVNGDHVANGIAVNGAQSTSKSQLDPPNGSRTDPTYINGAMQSVKKEQDPVIKMAGAPLQEAPEELLHMLSTEFYVPMAKLVSRAAQNCWNDLTGLVERLASMPVAQNAQAGGAPINDQSRNNLDKKEALFKFANDHKADFIKLLVLLQWSKKGEDVRKTIELNFWLQQRRQAFNNATGMLGAIIRGLADAQVPNPDLYTAGEVLSTGKVSELLDLGYIPQPPLTPKQIIKILKRLDNVLCTRMALEDDIPSQLSNFHIHDGRVTFTVADEFEVDLSLMDETPEAKFGMVDFRFLFSPAPSIPDTLHDEISFIANGALDKDGLVGVYNFLHELTLSYKLNEFYKQARELAQGLWATHLRVEMHRRTLVVQYWLKRSIAKSWFEIGIHSGKSATPGKQRGPQIPELRLRWLREGKLVERNIFMDTTSLSLERILRQVIANHTNHLFDGIYDKLLSSPLYMDAELELDQTSSRLDPGECNLAIQMSKGDSLNVALEPVSGIIVLSPVSERTSRLQGDLARSKNLVDEFVHKLPGLRCAIAESNLLKTIQNSQWERLEGLKPTLTEAEIMFGYPVTRASFFRLRGWSSQWMLAVTQSATGDYWWLSQKVQKGDIRPLNLTELVKGKPLHLEGPPSPTYLERLAEYTTGMIVLQSNAQYLNNKGIRYLLQSTPPFDDDVQLPSLQFAHKFQSEVSAPDIKSVKPKRKNPNHLQTSIKANVELSYHGFDQNSGQASIIARASFSADPAVLKELAASQLDPSVAIVPDSQQVMIRLESDAGNPVIDQLMAKLSHLDNIVACAATVNKSSDHTLQSLSLSAITILYHSQPGKDLGLVMTFATAAKGIDVQFVPADSNPHRYTAGFVSQMLTKPGQSLSANLLNVFGLLKMTQPMLSYLHGIQSKGDNGPQPGQSSPTDEVVRVHVLTRQPAAYGIQYFARSPNFARDVSDQETPKRLLARFEILPMKRGTRLMWLVRPSIEEFNSYTRPSYTSNALQTKLKADIFGKASKSWLSLDGGAACPSDRPEELLSTLHSTLVQWIREAVKTGEGDGSQTTNSVNGMNIDGANDVESQQRVALKQHHPQQRPNGVSRPTQQQGHQRNQNFNSLNILRNQPGKNQEVITLD